MLSFCKHFLSNMQYGVFLSKKLLAPDLFSTRKETAVCSNESVKDQIDIILKMKQN